VWSPPQYVERGGEICYRQPFRARDVRMYMFVLQGDERAIGALYDNMFVRPSGGSVRVVAVGPYVALTFVELGRLNAAEPPDDALGSTTEREATMWVPALETGTDRWFWAIPYIFVDNSWAMASGREIYGFPKQFGTVGISVTDGIPTELTVDTTAIERYGPDSVSEQRRVMAVERTTDTPFPLAAAWSNLAEARRTFAGPIEALLQTAEHVGVPVLPEVAQFSARLVGDLVARRLQAILLKQFRDSEDPRVASYQAVVTVPFDVTGFHGGGLLPNDYVVTINHLDTEPIRRELGFPAGSLRPLNALWLEFDFVIQRGDVLWQAGR
jgi:hypothetical protein